MPTKIHGASDDLIEFIGDVYGEVGHYSGSKDDNPCLVVLSDGTLLAVNYGKPALGGVWSVTAINKGTLFDRIDTCEDEDADIYSDVAHFKDGLKWAYAATKWEKVK